MMIKNIISKIEKILKSNLENKRLIIIKFIFDIFIENNNIWKKNKSNPLLYTYFTPILLVYFWTNDNVLTKKYRNFLTSFSFYKNYRTPIEPKEMKECYSHKGDNCIKGNISKLINNFTYLMKLYIFINTIAFIIKNRININKYNKKSLQEIIILSIRSSSFLSLEIFITGVLGCITYNIKKKYTKYDLYYISFISSFSIFIESSKRREIINKLTINNWADCLLENSLIPKNNYSYDYIISILTLYFIYKKKYIRLLNIYLI